MAIRGNLRTLNLRNLVQVNCQGGYTSRIHVWTDRGEGEIYIERGQVVHAWFERMKGKEALLYILSLSDGEFLQEMNIPAPERTIDQDWMMLFLETLQKQEETSTTRLSASLGVEEEPLEIPLLEMDPQGYERQVARLQEVRRTRDNREVMRTLNEVREAARNGKNLMYPILDAVAAYATLGEIMGVLREEFGEWEEPVWF